MGRFGRRPGFPNLCSCPRPGSMGRSAGVRRGSEPPAYERECEARVTAPAPPPPGDVWRRGWVRVGTGGQAEGAAIGLSSWPGLAPALK